MPNKDSPFIFPFLIFLFFSPFLKCERGHILQTRSLSDQITWKSVRILFKHFSFGRYIRGRIFPFMCPFYNCKKMTIFKEDDAAHVIASYRI